MGRHVDATFYAQVEPSLNYDGSSVSSAKVVSLTQKKPDRPKGGAVLVKLTIRVPEAAFLPLRPEAIVVIPEDMTVVAPLEVVAEDPS
jgi:hypothetical protein